MPRIVRTRSRSPSESPPPEYHQPTTLAAVEGDLQRICNLLSSRQSKNSKVTFLISELRWHLRYPGRGDPNNSFARYLRMAIDGILPMLLRESEVANSHRARVERGVITRVEDRHKERLDEAAVQLARSLAVWRSTFEGADNFTTPPCKECGAIYGGEESLRIHRILDHDVKLPNLKTVERDGA